MAANTGKAFDWRILRRTLSYMKPYKRIFYAAITTTILLACLSPLRPFLIQMGIDNYVIKKDSVGLLNLTILLCGLLIAEALIQFANEYFCNFLGQHVIQDIRTKVFSHILNFKLTYFDNNPIGMLVTRTTSDTEAIADVFSQGLLTIIGDVLKLVVLLCFMFYSNVKLTLISLTVIPVLLIATNIFKNAVRKAFNDVRNEVSKLNSFVQEHIVGISVVQIFNREEVESDSFREINARHRDANISSIWHYSVFFPVVEILSAVSLGLLIWWGGSAVLDKSVTLGELISFILYINMVFRPIRMLADRFNTLQMGVVCSERVFKILDTDEEISNRGKFTNEGFSGKIEFKNVWFAYKDEDWVLQDFNLTIEPGQTIAIVGSTGSGKSTIVNLVCRFYEFQKGDILIDGVSIRDYELHDYRARIGLVLQDVFLFSDSILNNIAMYDKSVTLSAIEDASDKIGVRDFIQALPDGFNYDVKERGAVLSAGQRQLISFVRTYVRDPKILILDEATSSIDSETELKLQYATDVLTKGRTSIVVAHRLSTIEKAQTIVVLEKGKVIEQGSHNELLKINGKYRRLYEMQYN